MALAGLLGAAGDAGDAGPTMVFSDVLPYLTTVPDGGAGAIILLGCSDRLDLAGKVGLVEQSVRAVRAGGTIVVLATDGAVWERALSIPERDLAAGAPPAPRDVVPPARPGRCRRSPMACRRVRGVARRSGPGPELTDGNPPLRPHAPPL